MTSQTGTNELNYALDVHGKLPIALRCESLADGEVKLTANLDVSGVANPNLRKHLKKLNLRVGDEPFYFTPSTDPLHYEAALIVQQDELEQHALALGMDGVAIGHFHLKDGALHEDAGNDIRRLMVFETRGLTHQYAKGFPYSRDRLSEFDPALHSPTTDLHSHLTSQISAEDLLQVAKEHHATYPVELLLKMGIKAEDLPHYDLPVTMQSLYFAPTAREGLVCETLAADGTPQQVPAVRVEDLNPAAAAKLHDALTIPIDKIYTFDGLERSMYRFRNPFSKNPDLIAPIILKTAESYQRQGVLYSEQSVTGALNTAWMEKAIPALEQAEEQYGVKLRFLVGIPRGQSPIAMLNAAKQAEMIAQSPYVVGVDYLGYEANKTSNFEQSLNHVAQWAMRRRKGAGTDEYGWDFKDDFVLRVHAGENGKNASNVYEALKIAQDYNVRIRIGHGVYVHMNDKLRALVKDLVSKDLLVVEFNPDSNMALNNIDFANDIPIKQWREMGVPVVLATDGAGAYQTDVRQSAIVALHAGLQPSDLIGIRQWEQQHIARQDALFADKKQAYEARYATPEDASGLKAHLQAFKQYGRQLPPVPPLPAPVRYDSSRRLPDDLKNRTPLLIAGASGSSWEEIGDMHQREIEIGIRMLVEVLDPSKMYFCVGRIKDAGITKCLDHALTDYMQTHEISETRFGLVGLLSDQYQQLQHPRNLNHYWPLDGGLMSVPHEMMQFIAKHNGMSLFAGGSAFTRDFIHLADEMGLQFGVMNGPEGASTEKARVLDKRQHLYKGALQMVEQVLHMQQEKGLDMFREGVALDKPSLEQLYLRIRADVEHQYMKDKVPEIFEVERAMQKSWADRSRRDESPSGGVTP